MKIQAVALPEEITPDWVSREHSRLLEVSGGGELKLDCSRLRKLDALSMAWLAHLQESLEKSGRRLVLSRLSPELKKDLAKLTLPEPEKPEAKEAPGLATRVGEGAWKFFGEIRDTLVLLSESLYYSTFALFRSKTMLREDVIIQMVRLGSNGLPIVLLLSTLIGFTLALQSGIQLQKFGATVFLASGMGISMVTEIGPIMTAVILAGRSGSSITAEISTMVVQEEVGALHAMAINPIHFLVLPRFWAMSLTVPLLTVCSAASGIAAGLVVGFLFFRLSPSSYLHELKEAVTINYVGQAMIKSLTFAWIIALVAINKGMNVRGGADAVGKATTSCVVTCIFSIIMADAVFSFIFYY
ncbi:MAG TPA: ABC transporter permease [Fibrobacteria bacterium]|nr:ABC transporter permease [Fibrobacteria bacterium]